MSVGLRLFQGVGLLGRGLWDEGVYCFQEDLQVAGFGAPVAEWQRSNYRQD